MVAGGFSDVKTDPINVYVHPDPSSFDRDTVGFINGSFGRIPGASRDETMAHELLGHTWSYVIQGEPEGSLEYRRQSVLAEDEVRRTDPERGLKIRHGEEVLTGNDLIRLRGGR